jgi:hypothetical protein
VGDYEPPGWCLGSEEFRQELLDQVGRKAGPKHTGEEVRQSAQAKAERLVRLELETLGWSDAELERRRKGHTDKLRIAERLRRETTMTLDWIAARLRMGSAGHVSSLLYRKNAGRNQPKPSGIQQELF